MVVVVVDANILFAALVSKSQWLRDRLFNQDIRFVSPKFILVELFKYKEKMVDRTQLNTDDFLNLLNILLNRIDFINDDEISLENWMEAFRLCGDTDMKDIAYVALALETGAAMWTRDEELKTGLEKNGFERFYE